MTEGTMIAITIVLLLGLAEASVSGCDVDIMIQNQARGRRLVAGFIKKILGVVIVYIAFRISNSDVSSVMHMKGTAKANRGHVVSRELRSVWPNSFPRMDEDNLCSWLSAWSRAWKSERRKKLSPQDSDSSSSDTRLYDTKASSCSSIQPARLGLGCIDTATSQRLSWQAKGRVVKV